jgi:Ca2+-transporting ATPase
MDASDIKYPWAEEESTLSTYLHTDFERGLTEEEVLKRLELFGENNIESGKKIKPFQILLHQFTSPLIWLLCIAAGLSFFFHEWLDGIAIVVVLVVNALIGFWMEFQAEHSMETLKKMSSVPARVIRNGKIIEISSENVVPGDLLFIEGGDLVTADARVIKASQLQTDESSLTGESLPVQKNVHVLDKNVPLAERYNMVYKGTYVTKGNGYALVVSTGLTTELGAVAKMVELAEQSATPLEKKIQAFSKKLIWVTIVLILIIFTAGLLNGKNIVEMLKTSIALAVAAIPEGLPIVTTLALAIGMLRMAKHNVLVKKLSSVETLGGTNIICTDKTGTLTQNKISPAYIRIFETDSRFEIDSIHNRIKWQDERQIYHTPAYKHIVQIAFLCNTASYQKEEGVEKESGDPMEVSLLKMVNCSGYNIKDFDLFTKIDEVPFTSELKLMATDHLIKGKNYYVSAKGAIEELLKYCTQALEGNDIKQLNEEKKKQWLSWAETQSNVGLRILGLAFKETNELENNFLHHLTLVGLIGFIDPPRPEVPDAIQECKSGGIKVVMITGDHPATAKYIAHQLDITAENDMVIHGSDMKPYQNLTEKDKELWLNTPVFARVNPEQKLDLVTLFQERNMIVGMTGDGVNDAPALKKADIGIAMGQRGTQVAQEVADMILKDDSFSSIILAIKQGRIIFENIRRFVIFLLSCNLSELFIISIAAIFNLSFQLNPLQILFINLVTDVLPALALGVIEGSPHIMKRKPYNSSVNIIDKKRWKAISIYSGIITITTITAVLFHDYLFHQDGSDSISSNNVLFYTLIFSQILHVYNMGFEPGVPFYRTQVIRNKYIWIATIVCIALTLLSIWILPVREVLKITIDNQTDWIIIIGFSILSMLIIQLLKKIKWVI